MRQECSIGRKVCDEDENNKLSLSHYLYIFSIIFICRLLVCITHALIFRHMYYDIILRGSLAIYIYLHYCIICIFLKKLTFTMDYESDSESNENNGENNSQLIV